MTPKSAPNLHLQAARLYQSQNNLPQAVSHYRQALAASPRDTKILLSMARLYDRQGEWQRAESLYVQASEIEPQNTTALNDLALCYARQKKLDAAIWTLRQAVELDPESPRYRNNLASVMTEAGHVDQALQQLAAVLEPADAHYNVGYLLARKGSRDQAEFFLNRALELDPSMAEARDVLRSLRPQMPRSASGIGGMRCLPPV